MKENLFSWLIVELLTCIICITAGFFFGRQTVHCDEENIIINDTIYNTIILDSIQYNIITKDSTIYNLKQEMQDEVKESYSLNDSASVELFKKLLTN